MRTHQSSQLRIDPIACHAHGLCHELLPEWISLDEWGYPLLPDTELPPTLVAGARRVVAACPALALRLSTR